MTNLKTYLTEAYAIDNKSILRILTQDKQINKADPNYSQYVKLANWANSNGRQQKLKNIDLGAILLSDKGLIEKRKLTTRYATLGHLLNALKNLMDQEGKYTPSSELSRLIQQTTLDILNKLSSTKEATPEKEPDGPKEEKPELYAGMDWTAEKARRLANAKEPSVVLEKFYNDYYNIEYANGDPSIVAKLKSLDRILIPEFNALGYNPEVNPLAQFLKNLIKHKRDGIFNKLNTNNYGAIHNAFIDKHITGNMLGQYNEEAENILFCSDLYNHKGLDIVKYLSLQRQVIQEQPKSEEHKGVDHLLSKIFIQQATTGDSYSEKINSLLKDNSITPISSNSAKLKSILEIQELYNYLFGHKPEDTEEITQIIEKAISETVVLDMIYCVASQAKVEAEYKKAVANWLKDEKYKKADKQVIKCKQILLNYDVSAGAAKQIIQKLIRYYNKNIHKEAADK